GRQRQPGEAVAGQESLAREVAVAVEVGLDRASGRLGGQQLQLGLCLAAEPLRLVLLLLALRGVPDDLVLLLSLLPCRSVQGPPAVARVVELPRRGVNRPLEPAVIEPRGRGELSTDRGEDGRRPITRTLLRGRGLSLRLEVRQQLKRRVFPI